MVVGWRFSAAASPRQPTTNNRQAGWRVPRALPLSAFQPSSLLFFILRRRDHGPVRVVIGHGRVAAVVRRRGVILDEELRAAGDVVAAGEDGDELQRRIEARRDAA